MRLPLARIVGLREAQHHETIGQLLRRRKQLLHHVRLGEELLQRRLEFVQSVFFLKVAHGLRDVVLGAMLREISRPFLEHVLLNLSASVET